MTRVALVTGAAVNIGAAIARRLASDGFDLGLTAETPPDATVEAVERAGRRAVAVPADLRDASGAAGVVEEVVARLGRVDVLVNNAGRTYTAAIEETSDEALDDVLSINLKAGIVATRAAVPHMRAQGGGSVVFFSSIHGRLGSPGHSAYAATKGAIDACVRELAVELGPDGIRVNAIAPGFIAREGRTGPWNPALVPLGRLGTNDDVASAVSWLASDGSSYCTGQSIGIDGGWSVKMPPL